ncbi:cupin domain-containing protein [Pontibacter liquoris]|uniref:cupin domain-containing protein n=1 Tax=Pontibacter liquoris TaxID=2905677 RepID=UPI001FA7D7DE|nr:cupin domain-containing protein [Pontibacter liquoris]
MEMKEIHANAAYKVLKVTLAKGEKMPQHFASSDAFLILEKGKVKLQLPDKEVELVQGATWHIPAGLPHSLQVLEDFSAYVVLAGQAQIKFTNL